MSRVFLIHVVAACAAVSTAFAATAPTPGASDDAGSPVSVIVQAATSTGARAAVDAVGGVVTQDLPIVQGVAASIPTAALSALRVASGVRAVTPDEAMKVQSDPAAAAGAASPASVYRDVVKSKRLGTKGYTGQGVTVALLDTGVSPSPDIDARMLDITDPSGDTSSCVNLSGEPTCDDGYGHGTFLAGLIAGSGAVSGGVYAGVAPSASLVSIKVASSDGSADVSNVLAGIQWAVSFKDEYGIRVLNLSLGTDSTQSWKSDPLNYAVEKAWDAGIVVVVAASNRGPAAGTISKPGDDPWVITVGAIDDYGTVGTSDDRLPDFSARGPTAAGDAKPDVVAPGGHLISLVAPGSAVENAYPSDIDSTYRRGSGTSQATAVVSGVVAAVLSKQPTFAPNRLKHVLTATAKPTPASSSTSAVGKGVVDAYAAAMTPPAGQANKGLARSSGLGSLDLSRGNVEVMASSGLLVDATLTSQLLTWELVSLTGPWTADTWWLSTWYLNPWYTTTWPTGDNWEGDNWEGCSQGGTQQTGCVYGDNWEGAVWYGGWV